MNDDKVKEFIPLGNTEKIINVLNNYLTYEKFEEFIKLFNRDIETRTSYINLFFSFKNLKELKPESIKDVKLEIENKDFKTKTYKCSLSTGKDSIQVTYNFISGQCITTFEKDITEELQLYSIPNQHTRFIINSFTNSSNLDLFKTRSNKIAKGKAQYRTNEDNTAILKKTDKAEITIDLGGSISRPTKNIALYMLHLLGLQNITTNLFNDESIEFPLADLVEIGMYKQTKYAREGFYKAHKELANIKLSAVIKNEKGEINNFNTSNMFIDVGLNRGTCYFNLNHIINWSVFCTTYALLPKTYWSLTVNAQDLFYNIFSLARQQTKGHKEKEISFNISFRNIQAIMNLPSEYITEEDIYSFIDNKIESLKKKTPGEQAQDKILTAINNITKAYNLSIKEIKDKISLVEPLEKKEKPELEQKELADIKALIALIKSQIRKNPKRDIMEPILKAIEECQNREDAKRENFIITPVYDKNGNIKTFLDGYLQVTLKNIYAEKIIEISNKRERYIQLEKDRQERIKEQAHIKALANKIKKDAK